MRGGAVDIGCDDIGFNLVALRVCGCRGVVDRVHQRKQRMGGVTVTKPCLCEDQLTRYIQKPHLNPSSTGIELLPVPVTVFY
jgi:hypothetical protein